jgi:hypothetical protein
MSKIDRIWGRFRLMLIELMYWHPTMGTFARRRVRYIYDRTSSITKREKISS